jgi:hypothetical protein
MTVVPAQWVDGGSKRLPEPGISAICPFLRQFLATIGKIGMSQVVGGFPDKFKDPPLFLSPSPDKLGTISVC